MATPELDTATLFTPGRASFLTSNPETGFLLRLSEASEHRAEVAASTFDSDFHLTAVFAGGYPGVAEQWPEEQIPPLGRREADLMAQPLKENLRNKGWREADIEARIVAQGESNNSIGDVLLSVQKGLLKPDEFHSNNRHGLDLVAGAFHGARFQAILACALDIDPARIRRVPMRDIYGRPATELRSKELAPVALAKEVAALAVTKFILRDVRPGNLDDLSEAEQRFNAVATKSNN
jgi:hypothetical protein